MKPILILITGVILLTQTILIFGQVQPFSKTGTPLKFEEIFIDPVIDKEQTFKFSEFFSDYLIIPLETNNESLIGHINEVKLSNDTFFIFDKSLKTIFLFSKNGKYLSKICKLGKGPGEYLNPVNFELNTRKREITIFDWNSQKLIKYNYRGDFISEISIGNRYYDFVEYSNSYFFFINTSINRENSPVYMLNHYNSTGKLISKNFSSYDYSYGFRNREVNSNGYFYSDNDKLIFSMPFSDTIYTINDRGVFPYIILNTEKYKITKEEIESLKSGVDIRTIKKLYNINSYGEFNNSCFFKFLIGKIYYITVYNKRLKEIICSSDRDNDLAFIYPDINMISRDKFIGIINESLFPKLKELVSNGKINVSKIITGNVDNIKPDDNPLLIIYYVKKDKN